MESGSLRLMLNTLEQPLMSVMVTVYTPADRLLLVAEELPLLQLKPNGDPFPPEGAALMAPSVLPKQEGVVDERPGAMVSG